MAKKIHKTKKTPLLKNVGFYFVLFYALLTLGMIVQVFTVNVIPMKYAIIVCVILLLLLLGMYYLQLGKKVNKVNKVLGKILIIILAVFLGVGNWYLFKTGSAFSRMTGDDTQTSVVSVVVMKESKAESIGDLKNSKFGLTKTGSQDTMEKGLADIKKDAGQEITTVDYKAINIKHLRRISVRMLMLLLNHSMFTLQVLILMGQYQQYPDPMLI